MENEIERPSLLVLNEYCLLEIFQYLDLSDSVNLAKTSVYLTYLADRVYKIKQTFKLESWMVERGDQYVNRLLSQISQFVSSLTIDCYGRSCNLSSIINDCNNLKSLKINWWRGNECDCDLSCSFDNVELLSFDQCNLGNLKRFLGNFHKLKALNISRCHQLKFNDLTMILENNSEMESLFCLSKGFDFQLLERIKNVKRLALSIDNEVDMNPLLELDRLTKFRVDCNYININNILSLLAKKGVMNEMELDGVKVDDHFFHILESFKKLELLVIRSSFCYWKLKSSTAWSPNLKRLRFDGFEFTYRGFISLIEQLMNLESMDLRWCKIPEDNETYVSDVTNLSQQILNIRNHGDRKQKLDVALPNHLFKNDYSKKYLVNSKRLRILHWSDPFQINPFGIRIHFPGW